MLKEWLVEPPSLEFSHEGLECYIRRETEGHLCGFVGVPREHPLYRIEHDCLFNRLPLGVRDRLTSMSLSSFMNILHSFLGTSFCVLPDNIPLFAFIPIHGGLCFSGYNFWGSADGLWWFGFQCGQTTDGVPSIPISHKMPYRNLPYVEEQVRLLATDLSSLGHLATS